MNGVGMLNSYKLGMVGKRLKQICGTDISCFKDHIQKEETYIFPDDQNVLLEEVKLAFPECSSDMCQTESNLRCEDKLSVFKKLRQAAFLNPSNKELWRELPAFIIQMVLQKMPKE